MTKNKDRCACPELPEALHYAGVFDSCWQDYYYRGIFLSRPVGNDHIDWHGVILALLEKVHACPVHRHPAPIFAKKIAVPSGIAVCDACGGHLWMTAAPLEVNGELSADHITLECRNHSDGFCKTPDLALPRRLILRWLSLPEEVA